MTQGRSGGNDFDALMPTLRSRMIARLPERARVFRAAADRLEQGDDAARADVREAAHKLAGIAASYGFEALGTAARTVELSVLQGAPSSQLVSDARALAGECQAIADQSAGPQVDPEPVRTAPTSSDRATRPTSAPNAVGVRVLVIDDDEATARLLELTLARIGGFTVKVASCASEAFEVLASERYDVVVCDAMMPDIDGLAFVERVRREMPQMANVPILILSAASAEELEVERATYKPDGWFRKPIRPQALVEALGKYLGRRVT